MDMFTQDWLNKKRGRDLEDEYGASGFSEHRQKRRIASLPHRTSPNAKRQISPPFVTSYTTAPLPPTLTPADSDNEETASATTETQERSFFSPWSSPGYKISDSQSTTMANTPTYSDDMEMADAVHLSPGPFINDPSPSISGRIPTPIHSSFAPYVRSDKPPRNNPDFADDESMVERIRRGRRLPSPISEGEMSPSIIVEGLEDMQMEIEPASSSQHSQHSQLAETPTKKGHSRSKHSLRSWTGYGGDLSGGVAGPVKRTFSMGYRSDCEKCRMKVPGHFSHIITYD